MRTLNANGTYGRWRRLLEKCADVNAKREPRLELLRLTAGQVSPGQSAGGTVYSSRTLLRTWPDIRHH